MHWHQPVMIHAHAWIHMRALHTARATPSSLPSPPRPSLHPPPPPPPWKRRGWPRSARRCSSGGSGRGGGRGVFLRLPLPALFTPGNLDTVTFGALVSGRHGPHTKMHPFAIMASSCNTPSEPPPSPHPGGLFLLCKLIRESILVSTT